MIPKNSPYVPKLTQKIMPGSPLRETFTPANQRRSSKIYKAFQKTQIQVKNQILDDLLQVYGWRSKTQLPIAKVMFYKVVQRNIAEFSTTIEVSYESFPWTLTNFSQISMPNILYLLKQSIIGFQKLFSVFGSFLISNKMIGINKNNRCKVWINQNFAVNQPIDLEMFRNLNQKDFLKQVSQLFRQRAQKNKNVQVLFNELADCSKFQNAAQIIQNFAKNYSIEIAKSYNASEADERKNNVSKSPIRNPNEMTNTSPIGEKVKRFPQFLNKYPVNQVKNMQVLTTRKQRSSIKVQANKNMDNCGIRGMGPLIHNRSQTTLYNISKTPLKLTKNFTKEEEKTQKLDYSFEKKNISFSPAHNNTKKPSPVSLNYFSQKQMKDKTEKIYSSHLKDKSTSRNKVLKSEVKTTHTNNSFITSKQKKPFENRDSIFGIDRNLIESIVITCEDGRNKNSLFSTTDLQHLGKLGKGIVQSCLPQDFGKRLNFCLQSSN